MTITIPAWLLWVLGIAVVVPLLALVVMFAVVGFCLCWPRR